MAQDLREQTLDLVNANVPPGAPPHVAALIAAWLRAVAMDEDEALTAEERRALVEVALEVERRGARVQTDREHPP